MHHRLRPRRLLVLPILFVAASLSACSGTGPSAHDAGDIFWLSAGTKTLNVRGLPDDAIPKLKKFERLQSLDFNCGWGRMDAAVTDVGLQHLAQLKLGELRTLDLMFCDGITDAGVAQLESFDQVELLLIGGCAGLTDESLRSISQLERLEHLDLRDMPQLTDAGLAHLARAPSLQRLTLTGCTGITDEGVLQLASAHTWLGIALQECWGVSETTVAALRDQFPGAPIPGPYDQRMQTRRSGELEFVPLEQRGPGKHGAPMR